MKYISHFRILITVISIVLFYFAFTIYSDFEKIQEIYKNVEWSYLFPIFGILFATIFIRSIIQRYLLKLIGIEVQIKHSFLLFLAGLSMIITPGGSGVLIKSYFIKMKYGYSVTKSMPLVFVERFFELVGIVVLISFTLIINYSVESSILVSISTGLIVTLLFIINNNKMLNKLFSILAKIKLVEKNELKLEFYESLNKLLSLRVISVVIPLVILVTFIESFMFYFGFLAFDVDIGYLQSIQLFYTSILFGSLFLIPGGIGVTEGIFASLLLQRNIELSFATSIIIFQRLSTLWIQVSIGFVIAYITIFRKSKNYL